MAKYEGTLKDANGNDLLLAKSAVNGLNDRIEWSLAGSVAGTGNWVPYPETAKELLVSVYFPNSKALFNTVFVIGQLSDNEVLMVGGYTYSASDYGLANCNYQRTNHRLNIRNAIYGGISYTTSGVTLTVRYKS